MYILKKTDIRQATISDLEQIDAFDVFAGDRKPEILRGEILVAVAGTEVLGFLKHNRHFYQHPFVSLVCVKKRHERQGIAKQLFGYVENLYVKYPMIFTSTEADNTPMLNFFEKYGYKPSGSIENIQQQPELVFMKKLQP